MRLQIVVLILAFSLNAIAQTPSKFLKDAEKALGGTPSLQRVASLYRRGKVTRVEDGSSGNIVIQSSRPNHYNISFDVGGIEIESGYNGRSGWTRDSRNGLRTVTGAASVALQAEASFRNSLWLDAKKTKAKIIAGGRAEVGGKTANVVILNTAKGATVKLFFDAASRLLVREEFGDGASKRVFEYSDHRRVGSIYQPHRMAIEMDGDRYDVVFDEIRPNQQIVRSEFDYPNLSNEPLPDIPSLLKEVQTNEERVEAILDTYSYVQKHIRRELGKDGVLRETGSETYQLAFYKGRRISRLIEKNGKPLSASDQAEQDKEAAERAEEIEKRLARQEKRENAGPPSDEGRRISIAEVLRASTLSNPRRERFRGRDVIVFDFAPNPSFDFKNSKSMLKFFGKTAGSMWIDEKDRQVARLEAFLADSYKIGGGVVAKLKKGASFTLEQERVNDEIWLPSTADINLSVRVLLVKGIELNQVIRSYDYRKFTTEVKDAKIDPITQ
jgi:hypothetical protein